MRSTRKVPDGTLSASSGGHSIAIVTDGDLEELLPLMRAYCDFYEVAPSDDGLLEVSRALLAAPQQEGLQLLARDERGEAVGFATIFWSWSTTSAGRIGTMHDLYVRPDARGQGVADRLISACVERSEQRGAVSLQWQTAPENLRAQAVYDRVGGVRERWLSYAIVIPADRRSAARQAECGKREIG
jgi:ribosomal protein S18 acetylase RimI-like enzyme